jgi:hypothetical protein
MNLDTGLVRWVPKASSQSGFFIGTQSLCVYECQILGCGPAGSWDHFFLTTGLLKNALKRSTPLEATSSVIADFGLLPCVLFCE